jgi:hypothetical protein
MTLASSRNNLRFFAQFCRDYQLMHSQWHVQRAWSTSVRREVQSSKHRVTHGEKFPSLWHSVDSNENAHIETPSSTSERRRIQRQRDFDLLTMLSLLSSIGNVHSLRRESSLGRGTCVLRILAEADSIQRVRMRMSGQGDRAEIGGVLFGITIQREECY